jgi:HlyD family secretion protein
VSPSSDRRAGRAWEIVLAVVAALAAGGAGGYLIASRGGSSSAATSEKPEGRGDRVTALGRLQPANGVVPVYGPPGDRIAKLYPEIAPGKKLKEGDPIADLESAKDRTQEVQVARVQLAEATRARDAAKRAGDQKILAAKAELNQAKSNKASDLAAVDAKLDYLRLATKTANAGVARLEKIRAGGSTVQAEDMEKAQLLAAQALAEQKATEAARTKTATTYEETEKAAEAKIKAAEAELAEAVARAPIESSEEKLKLAEQLSARTTIRAPIGGSVLRVTGREGQPTGVEPILQMADLSKMVAIAEVYESDVERLAVWVRAGPVKAEVKNPALPRPLAGVVKSEQDISRMIARNQVFAMGPREDADRRVVEVTVHLDPAAAEAAGRFVGLQVTVTMEPNK